jgi:tetratricopeptide (TPR) repeat protein
MKKTFLLLLLMFFPLIAPAQDAKTTAAVMDLESGEGISKGTAMSLSDYLRTQLVNTSMYTIITRENMEEVLKEQQFQLSNCTSQECIVQVGKLLGARKMFAGSIGKVGTTYLITLRIIDVESGKIEKAETEKCTECAEDALIKSIKNIVEKIIESTSKEEQSENILDQISGNLEADIASYTKRIKLVPNDAFAYSRRGGAYHAQGKYDLAIQDYTKAIELKFDEEATYCDRGEAYHAQGKHDLAIQDYTKAIELGPKYASTYSLRGNVYYHLDQYQRAIDDYTKAIELKPDFSIVYNNRGLAYANQRKYDFAINDYNKATELSPQYAAAYYNRGLAYMIQQLPTAACDDFYQAGSLYLKNGNRIAALKCVDLMKQVDPSSPLIKKLMDKIYEEQ